MNIFSKRIIFLIAVLVFGPSITVAQTLSDQPPHLTVDTIRVTLAEDATDDLKPVGATLEFGEDISQFMFILQNTATTATTLGLSLEAKDVEGAPPGQVFWSGNQQIGAEQIITFSLQLPQGGVGIGDYSLNVSGSVTAVLPFSVVSPYATATLVSEDQTLEGENYAAIARGGEISATSSANDFYIANRLIDGVAFFHAPETWEQCGNCGWRSSDSDSAPALEVRLGGGKIRDVSAVVLDTRAYIPDGASLQDVSVGFPKIVKISGAGSEIGTYRLRRTIGRHLIEFSQLQSVGSLRLDIVETFGGSAALSEIEVLAPDDGADLDLIHPSAGGALVRFTNFSDNQPAAYLVDSSPNTNWLSADREFPQDFTFAFREDGPAFVRSVEIDFSDVYTGESWPAEVAVAVSLDNPLDGFVEVARVPTEMRPGTHSIPIGKNARFIKLRILDNHGASKTTLGDIRVLGHLVEDDTTQPDQTSDSDQTNSEVGTTEQEPNDEIASGNPLAFEKMMQGEVNPLGEFDFFNLPEVPDAARTLTLEYDGEPYIRHELRLHDASGGVLSHFDPGDLPARDARLSFVLDGNEAALSLSEPPASIVVVWDVSGSMGGNENALERAVREYVRLAPDNQHIRLVKFSSDIIDITPEFTTGKDTLLAAMNGNFAPGGGTHLYGAIQHAMDLLKPRKGNRAIVVMTDGADYGNVWFDELWRDLERNRYRLYTIGLGHSLENYFVRYGNTGARILNHLALGTSGEAFFAREGAALTEFYARIANELAAPATYKITPSIELGIGQVNLVTTAEQVARAALPSVHVIFDVSGSMNKRLADGRRRIDVAKEAMYATLDALPEGAPFGLTVYGARIPERNGKERACEDVLTIKEVSPLVKQPVAEFVESLKPVGGTTPLARSVEHVVTNFRGEDGGIIIVITDGIEECDKDPLVTVEDLKKAGLDALELNVIGFDLRDRASRQMMEDISAIGGGRFFDASDGETLTKAIREAMAAPFVVRDAARREVASGKIDGGAVDVPAGYYAIEIGTSGSPLRINEVRVEADHLTMLDVNKVGSEIDVVVQAPRELNLRNQCGLAAVGRADRRDRIRRVQAALNALGFDTGTPDGLAGPKTFTAANAFREANGLAPSDDVNLLLEQHLDCVASVGAVFEP